MFGLILERFSSRFRNQCSEDCGGYFGEVLGTEIAILAERGLLFLHIPRSRFERPKYDSEDLIFEGFFEPLGHDSEAHLESILASSWRGPGGGNGDFSWEGSHFLAPWTPPF